VEYICTCSFLEIYNERIYDLLEANCSGKNLREDVKMGVHVEDLSEVAVSNPAEALAVRQACLRPKHLKMCLQPHPLCAVLIVPCPFARSSLLAAATAASLRPP
jgi:hypothetical protein